MEITTVSLCVVEAMNGFAVKDLAKVLEGVYVCPCDREWSYWCLEQDSLRHLMNQSEHRASILSCVLRAFDHFSYLHVPGEDQATLLAVALSSA